MSNYSENDVTELNLALEVSLTSEQAHAFFLKEYEESFKNLDSSYIGEKRVFSAIYQASQKLSDICYRRAKLSSMQELKDEDFSYFADVSGYATIKNKDYGAQLSEYYAKMAEFVAQKTAKK